MDILAAIILVLTIMLVTVKRTSALVNGFLLHSFFLFFLVGFKAYNSGDTEIYAVAALVLLFKVGLIPYFLKWIIRKINMEENIGLLVNPVISLVITGFLAYLSYIFATQAMGLQNSVEIIYMGISMTVILTGMFIMIFRKKALAQVVGLLVMENGLFLAVTALCGGMPFFVEIAVFFDVLVCSIILGVFIFRINELFTHIDTSKLTRLKG